MMYAVYNLEKGYLCNDEDRSDGTSYDHDIDEYTILFDKENDATFNCSKGEVVAMIEDNMLLGVIETTRMTKEDANRIYGKSFE